MALVPHEAVAGDPVTILMSHVPSLFGCTPNSELDLGGAGVAFGYKAIAEVDCQIEGALGVSLAIYMLYPSAAVINACSVQVDTAANGCPSGQCAQPPSAFQFAGEPLTYSKGRYTGSFVITTSCDSSTGYWPYAYNQRTRLTVSPSATTKVGTVGNQPLSQVSAISGTLTISGSPNSTGRYQGCMPYADTLSVRGTAQAQ